MMGRGRLFAAVVTMGIVGQLGLGATPASAETTAAAPYDFDGDGQPDLVVGLPLLDVAGHHDAGGVAVLAPTTRAVPRRAQVLTQSTSKVRGSSRKGDRFGAAVVSADLDGDGYADLAVGHPGERVAGAAGAGAVTVLYGTAKGLRGARSVEVTESGGPHAGARFGTALAAVDLDGDGHLDLAVGAPGDSPGGPPSAHGSGSVTVLHGSTAGVQTAGSTLLHGAVGPAGDPDVGFGRAFAVRRIDSQTGDDLIVLSSGQDAGGTSSTGSVSYCGTAVTGDTMCRQLAQVDAGATQIVVGKFFDFNDTTLHLGPQVIVGGWPGDGSVEELRLANRHSGPAFVLDRRTWDQQNLGLPTEPGSPARFGAGLAAGDVNGDGYDDLVVGAPGESVDGRSAGRVYVVLGRPRGFEADSWSAFDEDTPGAPGGAESGDAFGGSVALIDRNADGVADLVIGSPGEDHGRGRVTVLPGTGSGFTTTGAGAFSLATYGNHQRSVGFGTVLGR